jgi:hypothetical protein
MRATLTPDVLTFRSVLASGPLISARRSDEAPVLISIGDRTPGIIYEPDGGFELFIGGDPGLAHRSNWLPSSSFALVSGLTD